MNKLAEALKERATRFALHSRCFGHELPDTPEGRHVRDQLFRCSTGMAANDSAACRGRSHRDFVAKLGIVVEEADEAVFWLLFIERSRLSQQPELAELLQEARELLAIFTASTKTASAGYRER